MTELEKRYRVQIYLMGQENELEWDLYRLNEWDDDDHDEIESLKRELSILSDAIQILRSDISHRELNKHVNI